MNRKLIVSALTLVFCFLIIGTTEAHPSAGEHWQDIRYVLFGDKYYSGKDASTVQKRQSLEYASQICIDQFGSSHKSMMEKLIIATPRLSSISIEEIALFAGISNHRQYSHKGWNYLYENDSLNEDWIETKWPKRQNLLRITSEEIFNFNGLPSFIDALLGFDIKCDNFCALLYYIHILGDHIEFNQTTYHYTRNGVMGKDQVIPLGGTRNDSIISELLKTFVVLFPTQDYSELERELNSANTRIVSLLNAPDTLNTENGFMRYTDQAKNILKILSEHIPNLLRNEEFFRQVFY